MTATRAQFRAHWLEVQRHLYRHAYHGGVSEFFGWTALYWQIQRRSVGLLIPRVHPAPMSRARDYLAAIDATIPITNWQIETDSELDPEVETALEEVGWQRAYSLPGHAIPLDERFAARLMPPPDGYTVRLVATDDDVLLYADVQEAAYQADYGAPRQSQALFYADPQSLLGPHTLAALLMKGDEPVRAGGMYIFEGIAGGVGGACVPEYRGRHYGEPLMATLVREAIARGLGPVAHHVTMPPARKIAERLGFPVVSQYVRWTAPPLDKGATKA
jgi:GNAT superfamily N-acetyltransferase